MFPEALEARREELVALAQHVETPAQRRQAEEDLRALLPATFGYQAPFSLILRRGRSREPLIQAFRDQLRTQMSLA